MKEKKIQDVCSYENSVGHDLYSMANRLYWLIVILITLFGALMGALLADPKDMGGVAFGAGLISFIFGSIIASHYAIFIEAKAELLLRTARIQEDIDYLCRVKEIELAAKECPADQLPMQ